MKKAQFVRSIIALQKQAEQDREFAQNLGKAFSNCFVANLLPDNQHLQKALLLLLKEAMNDLGEDSWIEYFCFELDFGKNSELGVSDKDGKNIPLSTAEELWDFLISLQ